MQIAQLSNEQLLSSLRTVVGDERRLVARVLAYLAEVEERRLHLELAFSSMFDFCVRQLGFSEDQACRRMAVARLGRVHPQLITAIAEGRMHLSGIYQLREVFTDANVDEVIDAASGKSRKDIDRLLAKLAPKPDVPDSIRAIPQQAVLAPDGAGVMPAAMPTLATTTPPLSLTQQLVPLSEQSYRMTLTLSSVQHDKLERAKSLMRHRNPTGAIAPVLERALDLLLAELEKEIHGKVKRPRRSKGAADPRDVTNATRREVRERDGDQCSFVSATGERCPARDFLEHDHRQPRALGGAGDAANIRILCRAHNQFLAEQEFGREHMDRMRRRRKARPKAAARNDAPTLAKEHDEVAHPRRSGSGGIDCEHPFNTPSQHAGNCAQPLVPHRESQAAPVRTPNDDAHPRQSGLHQAGAGEGESQAAPVRTTNHDAHPRQSGLHRAGESRSRHDVVRYGLIGLGFRAKDTDRILDALPREAWNEPLETILRAAIARLT